MNLDTSQKEQRWEDRNWQTLTIRPQVQEGNTSIDVPYNPGSLVDFLEYLKQLMQYQDNSGEKSATTLANPVY
jgi:hypothetical protein